MFDNVAQVCYVSHYPSSRSHLLPHVIIIISIFKLIQASKGTKGKKESYT